MRASLSSTRAIFLSTKFRSPIAWLPKASSRLWAGSPYLVELANNTLALTNWKNHTEIVKRNSVLRDLVYASTNINALAYDAPDDTNEVIEDAEKMLFEVTQKRVSSSFQNITDLLTQAFDEIDELVNNKNQMAGTPTGFTDVDKLFWGLRGGDLLILGRAPWCW